MSTSSSESVNLGFTVPVASFTYRDMGAPLLASIKETKQPDRAAELESDKPAPGLTEEQISELINRARVQAVAEAEKRLRVEWEARFAAEAAKIQKALELFQAERESYFSRVESDVVHLALAIAAKILHREAQVDPLLVAALVRFAVDQLHDGSNVSARVAPTQAAKWRERLANPVNGSTIEIVEDASLGPDDCILETDLGSANFSIDAQLKEVEKGFFDLLAQRPAVK